MGNWDIFDKENNLVGSIQWCWEHPRSCLRAAMGSWGSREPYASRTAASSLAGMMEGEENKSEMDGYWVCVSDLMNGWHWSWPGAVDVQHFWRQFIVPEHVLPND